MKVPRLFLRCRASELVTRVRQASLAATHRAAETACLASLGVLLLAAAWLG